MRNFRTSSTKHLDCRSARVRFAGLSMALWNHHFRVDSLSQHVRGGQLRWRLSKNFQSRWSHANRSTSCHSRHLPRLEERTILSTCLAIIITAARSSPWRGFACTSTIRPGVPQPGSRLPQPPRHERLVVLVAEVPRRLALLDPRIPHHRIRKVLRLHANGLFTRWVHHAKLRGDRQVDAVNLTRKCHRVAYGETQGAVLQRQDVSVRIVSSTHRTRFKE